MNSPSEFPSPPACAHPATSLLQVERDGNPLRRYGHVSPYIGKLGPLDCTALDQIGQLTRFALPDLPEPTLVIGMTESSLLLAFFMARWQQKPVDLRFSSREVRNGEEKRAFREPHSHGPQHYLALAPGCTYAQIIIIEDELTTGATLRNLILSLAGVAPRVFVATLRDLRPQELRDDLTRDVNNAGMELEVLSMESLAWKPDEKLTPLSPVFNPFGRFEADRGAAMDKLERAYSEHAPSAIYMVGECVDIALQFWLQLPPDTRPEMRQITRSPWVIDQKVVHNAHCFPGDGTCSRYFIYNYTPPVGDRVIWLSEKSNSSVGQQIDAFFAEQDITSTGIEVEGT